MCEVRPERTGWRRAPRASGRPTARPLCHLAASDALRAPCAPTSASGRAGQAGAGDGSLPRIRRRGWDGGARAAVRCPKTWFSGRFSPVKWSFCTTYRILNLVKVAKPC
jgi:hypothetical protein